MTSLRVALIADYVEEGWPSMDLVADMLVGHLERVPVRLNVTLVRPRLPRRLSRVSRASPAVTADRLAARLWDYPRLVRRLSGAYDVYHVLDHSYAHLVHELPAARTLVTCHDLDTFRSILTPTEERRSAPFRAMTRRILNGFQRAAHVTCDTAATREAVVSLTGISEHCTTVVHNGYHPACSPVADATADAEADRLLGPPRRWTDVLHVGSTAPRKRIDDVIRIVAALRGRQPDVRLIRIGGAFTPAQASLARQLGVTAVVLPFVDRRTLAAIYRRGAIVLLPSEREGFGLPALESLACGTPVVASDIAALREVGGNAITYRAVGDIAGWTDTVAAMLDERAEHSARWQHRSTAGVARAARFTWHRYAEAVADIYQRLSSPSGIPC